MKTPKWFTEQDVLYTKRLFGYGQPVADLYVKKYVKMMNEVHKTDFSPEKYKEICLGLIELKW